MQRILCVLERWLLVSFIITIPWQVYFPLYGHIDLSVAICVLCLLFGLACARYVTLEALKSVSMAIWGYGLMLTGIALASLLRSPDNLGEAANVLGRLGVGFLVLCTLHLIGQAEGSENNVSREAMGRCVLASAAPLGVVGFILFLVPELEDAWLRLIAGILIEGDTAQVGHNILALDRVGVVFMNANVAAVFWGMSMWLALWMRQEATGWWRIAYAILAVIFCVDILSTGSRAGMLALVCTVIGALGLRMLSASSRFRIDRTAWVNTVIVVLSLCFVLGIEFFGMKQHISLDAVNRAAVHFSDVANQTEIPGAEISETEHARQIASDKVRLELLASSFAVIRKHPFIGYGAVDFATLGFPMAFPPHNFLLLIWIYGGVGALLGVVMVFLVPSWACARRLSKDHNMWLPLVVLLWVIVQAMFTNLILGELRIAMLLWIIVAPFAWPLQSHFAANASGQSQVV
jgi:hypothetical protein